MDAQLSGLVDIVCENPVFVSRVEQAVQWIASKPEGLAALQEARKLHGQPLKVVVDLTRTDVAYGITGEHVVYVNPIAVEQYIFKTEAGEPIQGSLERVLSHEVKHATQQGILLQKHLKERQLEIIFECFFNRVPLELYFQRLEAAQRNPFRLRKILGQMYDAHIGPNSQELMDEIGQKLSTDPEYQVFLSTYEAPAIEFENKMMMYKGEYARSGNYLNSVEYNALFENEVIKNIDRDGFIESALTAYKFQDAEVANQPPSIR